MNPEMQARFEELCNDEEYVKYILSLGSAEAMSEELESKEIDLSPEEIRKIGTILKKKSDGELSDEELEQVAGGFDVITLVCSIFLGSFVVATVGGLGIQAAVKSC